MNVYVTAETREALMVGLAKLQLDMTYVVDGLHEPFSQGDGFTLFELPFVVKTPARLDEKKRTIVQPEFFPGAWADVNIFGMSLMRLRAMAEVPSEISFRDPANPENEMDVYGLE